MKNVFAKLLFNSVSQRAIIFIPASVRMPISVSASVHVNPDISAFPGAQE